MEHSGDRGPVEDARAIAEERPETVGGDERARVRYCRSGAGACDDASRAGGSGARECAAVVGEFQVPVGAAADDRRERRRFERGRAGDRNDARAERRAVERAGRRTPVRQRCDRDQRQTRPHRARIACGEFGAKAADHERNSWIAAELRDDRRGGLRKRRCVAAFVDVRVAESTAGGILEIGVKRTAFEREFDRRPGREAVGTRIAR
jgi:hypothetical protein